MPLDTLSLSVTPIHLFSSVSEVSQGTGFIYCTKVQNQMVAFLVTNYHVLTGNPPNNQDAPIGDRIRFYVHESEKAPSQVRHFDMPIYTRSGRPIWLQSTSFSSADIAMIPIVPDLLRGIQINAIGGTDHRMRIRPTTAVALIGYPHGIHDNHNHLPIWKTGHIASEPTQNFQGTPMFLVDVAAYPGMSGSPVLAISYGTFEMVDGVTQAGYARQFLGVYASMFMIKRNSFLEAIPQADRLGIRSEESLQLGCVWKAQILEEIAQTLNLDEYDNVIMKELKPPQALPSVSAFNLHSSSSQPV